MKTCIVIPYFDHFTQFEAYLPELVSRELPLLVVDDASPEHSGAALADLLERRAPGSTLVRRETNGGKGAAVMTGLRAAHAQGFTHAVQVDADGQHDIAYLPGLLEAAERDQNSLICGLPEFGEDISKMRFYSRYLTLFFCWLETLSTEIRDALCGFRLYPLRQIVALLDTCKPGERMTFDPEILVRAVWSGLPLRFVPVHVRYPQDGKSHFRYFADNAEITWMHTRLISGMLIRIPRLLKRRHDSRVPGER